MRYRVNTYEVTFANNPPRVAFAFPVSEEVYTSLPASGTQLTRAITEAVRLIANETRGGVILMSTGQKLVVTGTSKSTSVVSGATVYKVQIQVNVGTIIALADGDEDEIAAINAMTPYDMYTIEMDWGDVSESGSYSEQLAEFFGVTLLQGYEFMTETEVTDELEDIMGTLDTDLTETVEYPAGSGQYMTKAQAITAQAMQIINPSQS